MNLNNHIHELYVLSFSSPAIYSVLINKSPSSLLTTIKEIFLNVEQLSFPINKEKQAVFESAVRSVEHIAKAQGPRLKNLLLGKRRLVQVAILAALDYLENGENLLSA